MRKNLQPSAAETPNATSDCPYGLCDGSGILIKRSRDGAAIKFCKCRTDAIRKNRWKFADIPEEFKGLRVNDFLTDVYTSSKDRRLAASAKRAVIGYVNNFSKMCDMGKGLYFYSAAKGSGKTRLAVSLGNALINKYNAEVRYTTTIRLLNEIKDTFDNKTGKTQAELIADTSSIQVLILDDIGVEKPTAWAEEVLFTIINERMINKKITVFTSNLSVNELRLDDRIKDRIRRMAVPVICPEESIRKILAYNENDEVLKILSKEDKIC